VLATRLLLLAMFPLMFALGLESWLIARVITNSVGLSVALAVMLVLFFSFLWFLLPRSKGLQRLLGSG
jgi:hypothetical protein